jgi:preprotein translocase subunit SecF
VNYAINKTLSRTVLTTITTLAVLICLVLFGGGSIFVFSFTMLVGVFIGTLSTMFVASPLLTRLHEKDVE